jgi:hypothetical protein
MFSRSDGPTALRADLVHALSFSVQQAELEGPLGPEPAVAALAAVWNGRKGFVAVLVRFVETQVVDRYVHSDPLTSDSDIEGAVEEALGFVESLGFGMDQPAFDVLDIEIQEQRMRLWNRVRKPAIPRSQVKPRPAAAPAPAADLLDIDLPAPVKPAAPAAPEQALPAPDPGAAPSPVLDAVEFEDAIAEVVGEATGDELPGDIDPNATITRTGPLVESPPASAPRAAADAEPPAAAGSPGRAVLGKIELVRRSDAQRPGPVARMLTFF